jgi:hypothetical protein
MNTSALYFCDFPPLKLGGGGLLMEYLLGNYPPDRLTILTGSRCATAGLNRRGIWENLLGAIVGFVA